jgi:hypothetical protein
VYSVDPDPDAETQAELILTIARTGRSGFSEPSDRGGTFARFRVFRPPKPEE